MTKTDVNFTEIGNLLVARASITSTREPRHIIPEIFYGANRMFNIHHLHHNEPNFQEDCACGMGKYSNMNFMLANANNQTYGVTMGIKTNGKVTTVFDLITPKKAKDARSLAEKSIENIIKGNTPEYVLEDNPFSKITIEMDDTKEIHPLEAYRKVYDYSRDKLDTINMHEKLNAYDLRHHFSNARYDPLAFRIGEYEGSLYVIKMGAVKTSSPSDFKHSGFRIEVSAAKNPKEIEKRIAEMILSGPLKQMPA